MERQTLVKISQVFSALISGEKTADQLSLLIYNSLGSAHLGFIYSILESQIEADVVTPIFRDKKIYFSLKDYYTKNPIHMVTAKTILDEAGLVKPADSPLTTQLIQEITQETKTHICPKCKKKKNISEFSPCSKYKSKIDPQCKECRRKYQEEYYKNITKKNRLIQVLKEKKIEQPMSLQQKAEEDTEDPAELTTPPDGTFAFLRWIEKTKKNEFNLEEFHKENTGLTMQQIEKVIAYQIKKGSLLQRSKDSFRLVK